MPTWTLLIDPISRLLDKIIPDPDAREKAKAELASAAREQDLEEFRLAIQADTSQTTINQTEAASESLFVAGWRPFIGWVCGAAFAYHFIFQPMIAFFLAAEGRSVDLPDFDMQELSTVLMGLLGLGGLRTIEKIKNVGK